MIDQEQFAERAVSDPQLHDFLQGVAETVLSDLQPEEPDHYISDTPLEILLLMAGCALYRYLMDWLTNERRRNETEVAMQQERIIEALIHDGFPPNEARETVILLLRELYRRGDNDPILKAARSTLRHRDEPGDRGL
jgi:hypothetical protein